MERSVSAGCVLAYALWALVGLLMATAWVLAWGDPPRAPVLAWSGAATSAVAATVHVRQFFVTQNRLMRDAFELGKEATGVRTLR